MVLFLIITLNDSDAHFDACCHFSTRWHFLQMVDATTGKVTSSMVIILALKVHCYT
jgi:hypothetical protein